MAEEAGEPIWNENPALLDLLRVELKKRGVDTFACPVCGANAWGGFTDASVSMIQGRDPVAGTVEGVSGAIHVFVASCGNCGFLCKFDREIIGEFDRKEGDD